MIRQLIYLSFILFAAVSCKKEEPAPSIPDPTEADPEYLHGSIDGMPWDAIYYENGCEYNPFIETTGGSLLFSYFAHFDQSNLHSPINYQLPGKLEVGFGKFEYPSGGNSDDYFNSSFEQMPAVYYVDGGTEMGPEVRYTLNNELWSTRFGSQNGSTFVLTTNTTATYHPDTNHPVRKLKGAFSCKVYKETDPTQSKIITSGTFYIYLSRYE